MAQEGSSRRNVARSIRNSPIQKDLQSYLERRLQDEREAYESSPASEFQRGQLAMLKDILSMTKE